MASLRTLRLFTPLLFLFAAPLASAGAHGPCDCLDRRLTPVGGRVTVDSPAYRVLLNPKPGQLGIAPRYLTSAYQPGASTVELLSRPKNAPKRNLTFRVPEVPPGLYMILIYDGGEGGAHNTWDYLHVIDPEQTAPKGSGRQAATPAALPDSDTDDDGRWWLWLVAGGASGAALAASWSSITTRRRNDSSRPDRRV